MTPHGWHMDGKKAVLPKKDRLLLRVHSAIPYALRMQFAEHRLLAYVSNLQEWRHRAVNDYLDLPTEKQNPVDRVTHTFGAALSAFAELPDALIEKGARAIDGKETYVEPLQGEIARTRRNFNAVFEEEGFVSKAAAIIRTPGDLGMDLFDFAIGNHHN